MIDWVHELCRDWGDYMRRTPKKWPDKNHVWRLYKEQGARPDTFGPTNPDWNAERDVIEVHCVWRGMPKDLRDLMVVFYVYKGSPKEKAEMLGISITKLYERRSSAHYYIVGRLDKKDSGISTHERADRIVSSRA